MARTPHPWWWEEKERWYVNYKGRRRYLGKHPPGRQKPRRSEATGRWIPPPEIDKVFRKLLEEEPGSVVPVGSDTVLAILDDFITWCKEEREPITARRYKEFCQDFTDHVYSGTKIGQFRVAKLTSAHVTHWLKNRATKKNHNTKKERPWGSTTKKNAITALQAAFNWAVANRGLVRNPIQGMKKPTAKSPRTVITPEEFETLLANATPVFKDLLTVSYDCGARPFEVKDLEARHIELDKKRALIPADEAKGRRYPRTIYFPTERCLEIIQRLCDEYPEGLLFRNNRGNAWTGDAVKCAFARLEPVVGKRVKHYDFRRTFITRKIIAGVDSHVVAKLSGHQSSAMVDRVYSAVANDHEFMLQQAQRDIEAAKEKSPDA